jgi:O-antigen biosynthesis protein WbqP
MIRLMDAFLSVVGLLVLSPLLLVLYLVGFGDTGAPLLWQVRVGRHSQPFTLVKFRTMRLDTSHVASHLADASAITPWGGFLRRTKLDELPQLWNVLKGEMSLVGPRPCLYNQAELIAERAAQGVFVARPGITGLAQINGIDMSTPRLLAEADAKMLEGLGLVMYFTCIIKAVAGSGRGDRIKQR